jgi:hypothetical protein
VGRGEHKKQCLIHAIIKNCLLRVGKGFMKKKTVSHLWDYEEPYLKRKGLHERSNSFLN